MINFKDWPTVPDDLRFKILPHAGLVTNEDRKALTSKGWEIQDVRVLPSRSDAERAEALKQWLEGIRLGSIEPNVQVSKFIELEARIYGLSTGKGPSDTPPPEDAMRDMEYMLDFGRSHDWALASGTSLPKPKRAYASKTEKPVKPTRTRKTRKQKETPVDG